MYQGTQHPFGKATEFQLITGNPESSGAFVNCTSVPAWNNGWFC